MWVCCYTHEQVLVWGLTLYTMHTGFLAGVVLGTAVILGTAEVQMVSVTSYVTWISCSIVCLLSTQ